MKLPLKTIIVENENSGVERIVDLLTPAKEVIHISRISRTFSEAEYHLTEEQFQLSILDVELDNNTNCHELIRKIGAKNLGIITLNTTFKKEDVRLQNFLQLPKPYSTPGVVKFLSSLFKSVHNPKFPGIPINVSPYLTEYFYSDDIVYIEGISSYSKYYLKNGHTIMVSSLLHKIKDQLNPYFFVRCHKEFVVNITYIKRTQNKTKNGDGEFVLQLNNEEVVIRYSRTYKNEIEEYFPL